jgi:DNA-directed RNA polymerase specialized sigma24 family protein
MIHGGMMPDRTHRFAAFPATEWTQLLQLRDALDERGRGRLLAELCRTYWFPIYGYARRLGRSVADAEDATQGFFEKALHTDLFAKADAGRGRLRTFLLTSFNHYLHHEFCKSSAQKRGGLLETISLDGMTAEERYRSEPKEITTAEDLYNRRWARDFFAAVTEKLRLEYERSKKEQQFKTLRPLLFADGKPESYAELASSLGVTEGNFRVMLLRFRRRYRELFRSAVADTLEVPTEAEIEEEIRELIRLGAR